MDGVDEDPHHRTAIKRVDLHHLAESDPRLRDQRIIHFFISDSLVAQLRRGDFHPLQRASNAQLAQHPTPRRHPSRGRNLQIVLRERHGASRCAFHLHTNHPPNRPAGFGAGRRVSSGRSRSDRLRGDREDHVAKLQLERVAVWRGFHRQFHALVYESSVYVARPNRADHDPHGIVEAVEVGFDEVRVSTRLVFSDSLANAIRDRRIEQSPMLQHVPLQTH